MAAAVGVSEASFLARYTHVWEGRRTLNERREPDGGYACVFLAREPDGRGLCTIRDARPAQCRAWPFWPVHMVSPDAYARVSESCPGVGRGLAGEGRRYTQAEIDAAQDSVAEDDL